MSITAFSGIRLWRSYALAAMMCSSSLLRVIHTAVHATHGRLVLLLFDRKDTLLVFDGYRASSLQIQNKQTSSYRKPSKPAKLQQSTTQPSWWNIPKISAALHREINQPPFGLWRTCTDWCKKQERPPQPSTSAH